MTEQDYRAALDWLEAEENQNKWENYRGLKLLVPQSEVPNCVIEFINSSNESDDFYIDLADTLNNLGLNEKF